MCIKQYPDNWVLCLFPSAQQLYLSLTLSSIMQNTFALYKFRIKINCIIMCCSGLFASVFQEIYGTKRVAVFGSFIAVIGLFSSAFSQSIYMLYVTYGFITGLL